MSRRRRRVERRERALGAPTSVVVSSCAPVDPAPLRELAEAVQVYVAEHPEPEPPERDLEKLSVATLRVLAGQRGIVLGKARTKAAIIEALRA